MNGSLPEFRDLTVEERHLVEQFLLPSASEITGILAPEWIEPDSLRAKTLIRRLLGLEEVRHGW